MTVITLIKIGEDYGVLADREGYIQGDHSLDSARAKYPQSRMHRTEDLLSYHHHRLYEIPGDFTEAAQVIQANSLDTKLYRHKDVLFNIIWVCKLNPDIGKQWYDKAIPALV